MNLIFNYEIEASIDEAETQKFLDFAVEALLQREVQLSSDQELILAFVSDQRSRELNRDFRGKDKSTDVLSFESGDPEAVGELVLCPVVIARQAEENSWDQQQEYCYMILHGLLHLLGYEHENDDKAAREMYGLQDDIFFEYFPGDK